MTNQSEDDDFMESGEQSSDLTNSNNGRPEQIEKSNFDSNSHISQEDASVVQSKQLDDQKFD